MSAVRQQDSDYARWGVEETCQYLRREGLEKWENKFRGWFSGLIDVFASHFWSKHSKTVESCIPLTLTRGAYFCVVTIYCIG